MSVSILYKFVSNCIKQEWLLLKSDLKYCTVESIPVY